MKRFGNYALGALMLAGSALSATLATTAPADARVSVGIGICAPYPGYYRAGYYGDTCANPRYRYYHPEYCYPDDYGPAYVGGFWFTDSFGHRHWHGGGHSGGHWGGGWRHH